MDVVTENGCDRPSANVRTEKGHFLKGYIGGPGRPKGSRNKLGEAFTEALYADFKEHGATAIQDMRANDPSGYCRVIASLLPKELKVEAKPLDNLTDDQLDDIINAIRTADGAALSIRDRKTETTGETRLN